MFARRGFRVRIGLGSGLTPGRDVVYVKAVSRRTAYAGPAMALVKRVSDAATGGMVLLATSAVDQLLPLPCKELPVRRLEGRERGYFTELRSVTVEEEPGASHKPEEGRGDWGRVTWAAARHAERAGQDRARAAGGACAHGPCAFDAIHTRRHRAWPCFTWDATC
jgi:hypothetical protein